MSPKALRLIGILFLVAAAVVGVLNLKRVADLGMVWLSPVLLVIGIMLTLAAKKGR